MELSKLRWLFKLKSLLVELNCVPWVEKANLKSRKNLCHYLGEYTIQSECTIQFWIQTKMSSCELFSRFFELCVQSWLALSGMHRNIVQLLGCLRPGTQDIHPRIVAFFFFLEYLLSPERLWKWTVFLSNYE